MTGKIVNVHCSHFQDTRCAIVRQLSDPLGRAVHIPIPITPAAPMQCPLEFMIQSEKTPLLRGVPKGPIPVPRDILVPVGDLLSTKFPIQNEKPIESKTKYDHDISEDETSCSIACQVFVPFMIAGLGTVGAGLLLDIVQNWRVFQEVPEMFVLVPALLGLKGNLEMTLASRVSTLANLGTIDAPKEQWKVAIGNLCLLQCQSLVLGMVASIFASIVGWVRQGELNFHNVLLLSSSSLVTASVASLLLGSLTIAVVVACRKLKANPDNVAAPLAASLGDVVTLALLAHVASFIFTQSGRFVWVEASLLLLMFTLIPLWAILSYNNDYTRQVLYSGWIPIISAVAISSGGGYILNFAVGRFKEIAACQPVINGVGGNLVAVQACRISTYLHQNIPLPSKIEESPCVSPCTAWFGKNVHSRTCRILVLLSIPGHLVFISCVHFLGTTPVPLTLHFLLFYSTAAILQVSLLLYIAHCLVPMLWRWGVDPDDAAIPCLTALGDLLGTALLLAAFFAVEAVQLTS